MAVVKAQRALMAVCAEDIPAFLHALQSSGLVEPIEPGAWPVEEGEWGRARPCGVGGFDLEEAAGAVRRALAFLEAHAPERGGLKSLFTPKPSVTFQRLADAFCEFPLEEAAGKFRRAEAELHRIGAEETRARQLWEALEPWREVDVPLSDVEGLRTAGVVLAEGPPGSRGRVTRALGGAAERVHAESLLADKRGERFLLVYLLEEREAVEAALREAGVSAFERPGAPADLVGGSIDWGAAPAEVAAGLERRRRELEAARQEVLGGVWELKAYREGLQAASDYVEILKARKEAEGWLVRVGDIALCMGWVLENRREELRGRLAGAVPRMHLEFLENGPEDFPPVCLENNAVTRPFAVLTGLYGLPKPREKDPTPLLAPFFFVFFGLCLTDSGYGIVIALLFWLGLRKMVLGEGAKDFFRLIVWGGGSTVVLGALVGGWFGNALDLLPQGMGFLKRWADAAALVDPIKNPVPFLLLSLFLGVVQIYVGLAAKLSLHARLEGLRAALLGEGVEIFLLSAFLSLGLSAGGVLPASWAPAVNWTAVAAAATTVLARGRAYKNVFTKLGGGLLSLYGLVGYLGDILSYSRLFALGLASGVIAMVVNTFGELLGRVPYVGALFIVVVFIVGHVFNLVISALGAFIHSARLQYVEFFTKFYEGGGRSFSPFRAAPRHVALEE